MAGNVYVNNLVCDKAGTLIDEDANINLKSEALKYVSRGGLKLEKAIADFDIDLKNKVCIDIGASTGGFTDCMLQNGAQKVYSIDVGYGQLDWKLRNDSRVVCMERTNFRYIDTNLFENENVNFASIDVSFISLKIILPVLVKIISKEQFDIIALIKPQFEAGRGQVGKKGVVKDPAVHEAVINRVAEVAKGLGLQPVNVSYSPITGPEGNIEYLLHLANSAEAQPDFAERVVQTVAAAHANLQPLRR